METTIPKMCPRAACREGALLLLVVRFAQWMRETGKAIEIECNHYEGDKDE